MMEVTVKNTKLNGRINAITSKSYAQRALFLSLLAKGTSKITIKDWSYDIKNSLGIIVDLGCKVVKEEDVIFITPPEVFPQSVNINAGESGTALRFIIPILAVLGIKSRIKREGSLIKRTNKIIFDLLKEHGIKIWENKEFIFIDGKLKNGTFEILGNISSQFISGLLIALGSLEDESKIIIKERLESRPYVNMTIDLLKKFNADIAEDKNFFTVRGPLCAIQYEVETDWSNALFFIVTGCEVIGLNKQSIQGDRKALDYLYEMGFKNISSENFKLVKDNTKIEQIVIDASDIPDTIPILSVISAISVKKTLIKNIKRLRLKESDRVKTTTEMLVNMGVNVRVFEDSFEITGVDEFKSCTVNSYNDHRIVMSSSIAALFCDSYIKILNAQAVKKSYVGFFEDFKMLGGEYIVK